MRRRTLRSGLRVSEVESPPREGREGSGSESQKLRGRPRSFGSRRGRGGRPPGPARGGDEEARGHEAVGQVVAQRPPVQASDGFTTMPRRPAVVRTLAPAVVQPPGRSPRNTPTGRPNAVAYRAGPDPNRHLTMGSCAPAQVPRASPPSAGKWQATKWPEEISVSSGSVSWSRQTAGSPLVL